MGVGDVNLRGVRSFYSSTDVTLFDPNAGYGPEKTPPPDYAAIVKEPLYAKPTVTQEGILFTNYSTNPQYNSPVKIDFIGSGNVGVVNLVFDAIFTRTGASPFTYTIISASSNRNLGSVVSYRTYWGNSGELAEGFVSVFGERCVHAQVQGEGREDVWRYWSYLSSPPDPTGNTHDSRNFYIIDGDQNVSAPLTALEPDGGGTYYIGQAIVPYFNGSRFLLGSNQTTPYKYRIQIWGQKISKALP